MDVLFQIGSLLTLSWVNWISLGVLQHQLRYFFGSECYCLHHRITLVPGLFLHFLPFYHINFNLLFGEHLPSGFGTATCRFLLAGSKPRGKLMSIGLNFDRLERNKLFLFVELCKKLTNFDDIVSSSQTIEWLLIIIHVYMSMQCQNIIYVDIDVIG